MLSPGFDGEQKPRKLLPEEQEMLEMLGWSEDQWHYFNEQRSTYEDIQPGEPTAFLVIPFLIQLVIGIALSYAATLLTSRQGGASARIEQRTVDGQSIVQSSRFAPTAGFDSQQNVVELGSIVPVVFTKRETIDGITYGGVRVNTNLLWSQMYSLGGSQLAKAMFMIGFGPIGSVDPYQFAIGDNLLSSYQLGTTGNTTSRLSFYFRAGDGRIRSTDLIAGRAASADIANSENAGAGDVFQVRSVNGQYLPDFCYASKPSTQTTFGLYAPIGNDLAFAVNPTIRSISVASLVPIGNGGDQRVKCNADTQQRTVRDKQDTHFSTRSGITSFNGTPTTQDTTYSASINDTIGYSLLSSSDSASVFRRQASGPDGESTCEDVAQAVSGLQRSWDDALVIGELYRIGTSVAVLESRSPGDSVFVSEADNDPIGGGQELSCTFRVIRPGIFVATSREQLERIVTFNTSHRNGTQISHIHRLAVATAAVSRPAQVIEIGFRSTSSIRISGLCNFQTSKTYQEADRDSCEAYEGDRIRKGSILETTQFQSGTYAGPEMRYSFFRFSYRIAGSSGDWVTAPQLFGFRSMTGQPSFNYLRIQFPSAQRWEWELMPVSGWEIRWPDIATGDLEVLDSKIQSIRTVYGANCVFEFSGVNVLRSASTFAIKPTQTSKNIGLDNKDGLSYTDAWGKLAEQFIYQEITASTDSPEHEISYVNIISRNAESPLYNYLSKIGVTIRSGPELRSFQQLSVYINLGFGSTHLIGDVLRYVLTNPVFGLGELVSPLQVDNPSFDAANARTYNQRFFFDGGISEPFNFRQQGALWAEYFLHDLLVRGGKFYLQPTALFGEAHRISAHYTSGNVSEFEYTSFDPDQRIPPRVTVKWREEKQAGDLSNRGLFPVVREVTVREAGTPENAPLEIIDLTSGLNNFCTSELHAISVGKMRCRKKRLIGSSVKVTTRPDKAAFDPGKIVKIGMQTVKFNRPQNGVILADGTVVSQPDPLNPAVLADGTYSAFVWNGTGTDMSAVNLVVAGGKNLTYAGSVYSLANVELSSQTYKIQKVDFTEEGDIEAEATEFPLDANNFSLLTAGWDVEQNWIIEGRIGGFNENIAIVQAFQSVSIFGPASAPVTVATSYSSTISGPAGSYTYSWSATGSPTIGTPTASATTFSWAAAGSYVITLSVVGPGSITKTQSLAVAVGAVIASDLIGAVTVSGPSSGATGALLNYTAASTGAATPITWLWSVSDGDPIVTAINAAASVRFLDPGSYIVRARASAEAPDDPQSDDFAVSITGAPVKAIGNTSIAGTLTPTVAATPEPVYVASFDGNATGVTWSWSVSPLGPVITGSGAFVSVAFPAAGSFTITAIATDAGAVDTPQTATLAVVATV